MSAESSFLYRGLNFPPVDHQTDTFYRLPDSPDILALRELLASRQSPTMEVPGRELIQTSQERSRRTGHRELCRDYLFDRAGITEEQFYRLLLIGQPTTSHPGAIAVYFNDLGFFKHTGIVRENDMIESKWGGEHVYLHRPEVVPSHYGNTIIYFDSPARNNAVRRPVA